MQLKQMIAGRWGLLILLSCMPAAVMAQSPPDPEAPPAAPSRRLQVSLLTMSPGTNLFTTYGHTAIRIRDLDQPAWDLSYDFGTYDASDPDAPMKFMKGKLPYWLSVGPTDEVVAWYGNVFVGITEQVLELDPIRSELLARQLARNALPANRAYAYHHFRDNCATRPRDLLDEAFGGALRRATLGPSGHTFRQLIDRSMAWGPYLRWPVYGLLNGQIDLPISRWEAMFLPVFLRDEVGALRVEVAGGGLRSAVREKRQLSGIERPANLPDPPLWHGVLACLGLALVSSVPLLLGWRQHARAARLWAGSWLSLYGLIAGGYGVLVSVTWAISPYPETKSNGNVLLFHPLLLLLVPLGVAYAMGWLGARRWMERLFLASLGAIATAAVMELVGLTPQQLLGFCAASACVALPSYLALRSSRPGPPRGMPTLS